MSRERRKHNGKNVIFDYRTLINEEGKEDKVLVYMAKGPQSYLSAQGTKFWSEHPFQWVDEDEAKFLVGLKSQYLNFREATLAEVEDYYVLD
jgi:hypothetical protein